jgi:hypothetical protein
MDEEERKRIAAAVKERAAKRDSVQASPSGITKSESEAAKERMKAKLAAEGALSGTAIEEPPGMLNQAGHAINRFMTEMFGGVPQEGDLDPKLADPVHDALGPLGYLTAPAAAAVGLLDTMRNRDERQGKVAPATTALNSILDVFSLGTLNKAKASMDQLYEEVPQNVDSLEAAEELYKQQNGEDFPTAAKRLEDAAIEQEKLRAANPNAAMASDFGAMVATGGGLGKVAFHAANKLPAVVGKYLIGSGPARVIFGSSVGAGEVFAYSLNKNGDLEKAATDASVAMLGGVALGGLLSGGKKLSDHLFGVMKPDAIQAAVGKELLDAANLDRMQKGLPEATAAEVAADLAKLGPDASLLDIFPGLQKYANRIAGQGGAASHDLANLIATRAEFFKDLVAKDGTLRTAFRSQAVLSEQSLLRVAKQRKAELSPVYDAIYAAYPNLKFSAKQILQNVETLFGDKLKWGADLQDAYSMLKQELAAHAKQATPKGAKKLTDDLSLEQAVSLKEFLKDAAGSQAVKVAGKDAAVSSTNRIGRAFSIAGDYVTKLVHGAAGGLKEVDDLYGSLSSMKAAYKAGKKAFASPDISAADIQAFMGDTSKSVLAKRAFVEGAKAHLFKRLDKATSATGIAKILQDERPMIESMEALFGKEATADMIGAVTPMLTKIKTAEQLKAAIQSGNVKEFIENSGPELKKLSDVIIAMGGPFAVTSKAGSFGAAGRILGRPVSKNLTEQADTFAGGIMGKMGEGASEAYRSLQALLGKAALPSTAGQAGAGAAVGAGIGGVGANMEGQE